MRRPARLDVVCGLVVAVLYVGLELMRAHFRLLNSVELETHWRGTQDFLRDGMGGSLAEVFFPLRSMMSALVRVSAAIFGAGPFGLRFPALVAGGVALGLLWFALRKRLGPLSASLGCAVLLAAPAHRWADVAGPQVLLLLCLAGAAACFLRIPQRPGWRGLTWKLAGTVLVLPALGGFAGTLWVMGGLAMAVLAAFLLARVPRLGLQWLLVLSCLTVAGVGVLDAQRLRRERHAYQSFVNQVERATAPGEEVRVDSAVTALPLDWYASPGLREQIHWASYGTFGPHHFALSPFRFEDVARCDEPGELVVVGAQDGGLHRHWAISGYSLSMLDATPDVELLSGEPSPMMRKETRVFLVAPAGCDGAAKR